jgi:hypothetical protein
MVHLLFMVKKMKKARSSARLVEALISPKKQKWSYEPGGKDGKRR